MVSTGPIQEQFSKVQSSVATAAGDDIDGGIDEDDDMEEFIDVEDDKSLLIEFELGRRRQIILFPNFILKTSKSSFFYFLKLNSKPD